jgi:hypothetical protein
VALSLTDDILAQFYERVFEASKTLDMKEEGVRLGPLVAGARGSAGGEEAANRYDSAPTGGPSSVSMTRHCASTPAL